MCWNIENDPPGASLPAHLKVLAGRHCRWVDDWWKDAAICLLTINFSTQDQEKGKFHKIEENHPPRIVLGNGDWLWPTLPGAHHMPHFVNKVEKHFKHVRMSLFFYDDNVKSSEQQLMLMLPYYHFPAGASVPRRRRKETRALKERGRKHNYSRTPNCCKNDIFSRMKYTAH